MSKGKKAGIIVGCIIAIIVIVVIATRPSGLPPLGPLGPAVRVDYEVTARGQSAYLSVTVEGPEDYYYVSLLNPEGEITEHHTITAGEMDDGHQTYEMAMSKWGGRNPIPGEYCLTVVADGKTVFEARPVFEGPYVSIMSVQFALDYITDWEGRLGTIKQVILQVYNNGDLPAFPDRIKLFIAGEEDENAFLGPIPLGETTISGWFVGGYYRQGTYPVTVGLYSEGVKLASYETYVTIE